MRTIKTIIIGTLILLVALIIIVFIGAAAAQPKYVLYPDCTYLSIIKSQYDANQRPPGFATVDAIEFNPAPCQLWTREPTSTPSVINPTATQYAPTSTPMQSYWICHMPGPRQVTEWIDDPAWAAHSVHYDQQLYRQTGVYLYDYKGECDPWPTPEPTSTPSEPPVKK